MCASPIFFFMEDSVERILERSLFGFLKGLNMPLLLLREEEAVVKADSDEIARDKDFVDIGIKGNPSRNSSEGVLSCGTETARDRRFAAGFIDENIPLVGVDRKSVV